MNRPFIFGSSHNLEVSQFVSSCSILRIVFNAEEPSKLCKMNNQWGETEFQQINNTE